MNHIEADKFEARIEALTHAKAYRCPFGHAGHCVVKVNDHVIVDHDR